MDRNPPADSSHGRSEPCRSAPPLRRATVAAARKLCRPGHPRRHGTMRRSCSKPTAGGVPPSTAAALRQRTLAGPILRVRRGASDPHPPAQPPRRSDEPRPARRACAALTLGGKGPLGGSVASGAEVRDRLRPTRQWHLLVPPLDLRQTSRRRPPMDLSGRAPGRRGKPAGGRLGQGLDPVRSRRCRPVRCRRRRGLHGPALGRRAANGPGPTYGVPGSRMRLRILNASTRIAVAIACNGADPYRRGDRRAAVRALQAAGRFGPGRPGRTLRPHARPATERRCRGQGSSVRDSAPGRQARKRR